jgi:hypothetical protein
MQSIGTEVALEHAFFTGHAAQSDTCVLLNTLLKVPGGQGIAACVPAGQ